MVSILPCQSSQPCHSLGVFRDDSQNGPPRLARPKPKTRLVECSSLLEKYLPLGRDRDDPIEMSKCAIEIPGGTGDACREKVRGGVPGPSCKTCLDTRAGRLNFALGEQHGGQKMIEHGIAGLAAQTLLTELARFIGLAGIEGGRGAANDVLGGCLAHIEHIICVIASEAKQSIATREDGLLRRGACYRAGRKAGPVGSSQ
jgi:hypothetical protein